MNKPYKTCLSLLIAVLICAVCLATAHAHMVKDKKVDVAPQGFGEAYVWKRLDPNLQQAWVAAKKSGAMDQRFECFVRVQDPASQGDENFLQSKGFNVRIFAGTIARGSVTAENLPAVAALPFVEKITLATSN
jgi:hypothetical protein